MFLLLIILITFLTALVVFLLVYNLRLRRRVLFYRSVAMDCPYVISEFNYPNLTYRFVSSASESSFGLKAAAYLGRTLR